MFFLILWVLLSSVLLVFILAAMGLEENIMLGIALTQIVGFFLPFLFYLLVTKQKPQLVLRFTPLGLKNTLLTIVLTIAVFPMVMLISTLSSLVFFPLIAEITVDIVAHPIWFSLIIVALFPALFEEFMFRGAICKEYEGVPIKKASIITGLFFGIIHLNFHQGIYAAALGVLLGYVFYVTKSIWAPILMHFVNNGVAVLLSYIPEPAETYYYDVFSDIPEVVISLVVFGAGSLIMAPIVYLCLKHLRPHTPGPEDLPASPVEVPPYLQPQPFQDSQAYPSAHAAAEAVAPPPRQKVFTWAFWATVGIFLFFGALVELGSRLIEMGFTY